MKTKNKTIVSQNRDIVYILCGTAGILLLPLLAGAKWDETDYLAGGSLLLGAGFVYLVAKRIFPKNKVALGVVVVFILMLLWAELAVGLFGSPFAGN